MKEHNEKPPISSCLTDSSKDKSHEINRIALSWQEWLIVERILLRNQSVKVALADELTNAGLSDAGIAQILKWPENNVPGGNLE